MLQHDVVQIDEIIFKSDAKQQNRIRGKNLIGFYWFDGGDIVENIDANEASARRIQHDPSGWILEISRV